MVSVEVAKECMFGNVHNSELSWKGAEAAL